MRCLTATLVLWLCISLAASAQQAGKAPLVGVLLINTAANPEPVVPLFRNALAGLGYVDDRNLRLDFRFAEGHADRFPALAAALVGDKANVIAALGDAATRAAQQATQTIPIVAIADDLVAAGLIQSNAKPGGNTTGISILATELDAKKLEILKQIIPAARRLVSSAIPPIRCQHAAKRSPTGRGRSASSSRPWRCTVPPTSPRPLRRSAPRAPKQSISSPPRS